MTNDPINEEEVMKDGKDPGNGQFVKGNQCGKFGHKNDSAKEAILESLTDAGAARRFKKLLNSDNETIVLNALKLWTAYRLGKPVNRIEADHTISVDNEVDEEIDDLIKGLKPAE